MTTILTVGNSEGSRRCDGKCHNATGPDCDCVCGGRYHGAGKQAQEMLTRDMLGDDWRETFGIDPKATLPPCDQQELNL